jgi:hypothetical protein
VGCEQDAGPMTIHQVGAIRAIVLLALAAMLIACSGCSSSPYGAAADTERGVCASEGQQATTSYSHGGYVTRCGYLNKFSTRLGDTCNQQIVAAQHRPTNSFTSTRFRISVLPRSGMPFEDPRAKCAIRLV